MNFDEIEGGEITHSHSKKPKKSKHKPTSTYRALASDHAFLQSSSSSSSSSPPYHPYQLSSNTHPEFSLLPSSSPSASADPPNCGAVLQLDVGGLRFSTTLSTLRAVPDSMLALMFSGRFPLVSQSDGSFFIDRDGTHFRYVLNYLRDANRFVAPADVQACRELLREVEYYQLPPLILLLRRVLEEQAQPRRKMYCTLRYLPGSTYDGWPIRIEGPLESRMFFALNGGAPFPEKLSPNVKNIFGSPVLGWKIRGIFITKIFNLLAAHGWAIDTSNGSGGGKEKNFAEMYIWSAPLVAPPSSLALPSPAAGGSDSESVSGHSSSPARIPTVPPLSNPISRTTSPPNSPPLSPTFGIIGTIGDDD